MKNTKKILLAGIAFVAMSLGMLTGCGEKTPTEPTVPSQQTVVPTEDPTPVVPDKKPVTKLSINEGDQTLFVNDSVQLTYKAEPTDHDATTFTWASDNTAVATVKDGLVNAVAKGEATISVTADGVKASVKVTVNEKQPTVVPTPTPTPTPTLGVRGIEISNKDVLTEEWHLGDADRTIVFSVLPDTVNATELFANGDISITSSEPTIVGVIGKKIQALQIGTARITVECNGYNDSCLVEVLEKAEVSTITVREMLETCATEIQTTNAVSETVFKVKAVVCSTENGSSGNAVLTDGTGSFLVYNSAFSKDAKVGDTVICEGLATNYYGVCEMQSKNSVNLSYEIVTEESQKIALPEPLEYTVEEFYAFYQKASNYSKIETVDDWMEPAYITSKIRLKSKADDRWEIPGLSGDMGLISSNHSSPEFIAIQSSLVDGAEYQFVGTVFGYNSGNGYFNCQGNDIIFEADKEVTSLAITSEATTVEVDGSLQLGYTINEEAKLNKVTWSSSDESIATISAGGLVIGVKEGKVTITLTSNGVSATLEIEVVAASIKYHHAGTAADPFDVYDTLNKAKSIEIKGDDETEYYIKGVVKGDNGIDTGFGNATFWIGDDTTEEQFEIYRMKDVGGEKITDMDLFAEGDIVIVKGFITVYKSASGVIYETKSNCELVDVRKADTLTWVKDSGTLIGNDSLEWGNDNFLVKVDKGTGTSNPVNKYDEFRLYKGSYLRISAKDTKVIKSVRLTYVLSNGYQAEAVVVAGGVETTINAVTYETETAGFASFELGGIAGVESLALHQLAQMRLTQIVIEY